MNVFKTFRFWWLWVAALVVIAVNFATDPTGGKDTWLWLLWVSKVVVAVGIVYLMRRVLIEARSRELFRAAKFNPIAASIAFLGICIVTAALLFVTVSRADELPARALSYLPVLDEEISVRWSSMPVRSVLGALVEQETCPSLKHSKCWNPRTELKTHREYGVGLGQLTVAYRADGTERFNAWREVRGADPGLAGWQWEDRYDARMQLRAVVVMNRGCFSRVRQLIRDDINALAMCDAAYNGGLGGLLQERRMCAARDGCDPAIWFGHVEHTSAKSRQKWKGYGMSAFEINRGHVLAVMVGRRAKYARWWGEA